MCAMSEDSPSQLQPPPASPDSPAAADAVALVSCGSQTDSGSRSPSPSRVPASPAASPPPLESAARSATSRLASLWSGAWPLAPRRAEKSTQTPGDPLQSEADRLAADVVQHVLGGRDAAGASAAGDPVARTLRLATDEILAKHRLLLNGMVARLQIRPDTCYDTFVSVADELFADDTVTWARIITLYAFGARLALYCQEKEMPDFVPEITRFLGMYVTEHLCDFVREQGGWSEMCRHFQYPESVENTVLTVLVKLGVGLGIAATATFLTTSR